MIVHIIADIAMLIQIKVIGQARSGIKNL